jgi:hypothetical protein
LLRQKLEYPELIAQPLSSDSDATLNSAMPHFHLEKSIRLSGEREVECLVNHFCKRIEFDSGGIEGGGYS